MSKFIEAHCDVKDVQKERAFTPQSDLKGPWAAWRFRPLQLLPREKVCLTQSHSIILLSLLQVPCVGP